MNVVGDHAVMHRPLGAPLASDIESVARPVSNWLRDHPRRAVGRPDAAEAVAAARDGGIATLIVPADAGWEPSRRRRRAPVPARPRAAVPEEAVEAAARALRSGEAGRAAARRPRGARRRAARRRPDRRAHRRASCSTTRSRPGSSAAPACPPRAQLPYLTAMATEALAGLAHLVTAGTYAPVGFFAYPDLPSRLAADDTAIEVLAGPLEDAAAALEALADLLGAPELPDPDAAAAARGAARGAIDRRDPRRSRSPRRCPRARSSSTSRSPPPRRSSPPRPPRPPTTG